MKQAFYRLVLWYVRSLAKLQLKKNKLAIIIGITGSAGKTSMMKAVEVVAKDKYKVKVSDKANSELGIPLNILGFKGRNYGLVDWLWVMPMAVIKLLINFEKYEVYVVEMGIDSPRPPKNMSYLLSIIQPTIGVFINTLSVHSEAFDHLPGRVEDNIAEEKGKLITSLPKDGTAVLNKNDKRVMAFKNKTQAKVVTFDTLPTRRVLEGYVIDEHYDEIMAGAIAVGKVLGITKDKTVRSLKKNFRLPPGRMTKIAGIKQTTLLDSSYNASREPVISALKTLNKVAKNKRIAVLGDMRELGKEAKKEHELVAEAIMGKVDELVLVGPLMKKFCLPRLLKLGFNQKKIHWFDNSYLALRALKANIIRGKETILVKGSQNTLLLEIIVEGLMQDKSRASKLLCRRGRFWDKKRKLLQSKV